MTEMSRIPAAQYLRMSTEHQQYSLQNQMDTIMHYAANVGFNVVQTYSDAARSGVVLRRRSGLRQLLQDVVGGTAAYSAILVYDVSRWGRFQDSDEAAHYEFICKSAGVPVHYCAETFANDGTMPSLIMKAVKRAMAAEYSRELGTKVFDGQKRLATLGFKQGGVPGYGLRRMLVDGNRRPKQQLAGGERKSIATDRVILVHGPTEEVECVRDIYQMLLSERRSVYGIARELNRRGVQYLGVSKWDYLAVKNILTHPKYSGCHVFGRTSAKLYSPPVRLTREKWTITPRAFEPIVDQATFAQAQRVLEGRTFNQSNEELLNKLRALLALEGRLSHKLVRDSLLTPSPSTYRGRFGSLTEAYRLIGYWNPSAAGIMNVRHRTQALRENLIRQIQSTFPEDISIVRRGGRWRSRLRVRNGVTVSVLLARHVTIWKNTIGWLVEPVERERKLITLLARLNVTNDAFLDFHILPSIDRKKRFLIRVKDKWLARTSPLPQLAAFMDVVRHVHANDSTPQVSGSRGKIGPFM
jgi:DNA invertase Pin-like site-specific DNA recombinase